MLSSEVNLELLGVAKNELLCLGSFLEKSSNFRPKFRRRVGL